LTVAGAPAKHRRPISPQALGPPMSRDPDEEFELVRRGIERAEERGDSLGEPFNDFNFSTRKVKHIYYGYLRNSVFFRR
jgi:hypothetical protein